jgi:hypothetical protein
VDGTRVQEREGRIDKVCLLVTLQWGCLKCTPPLLALSFTDSRFYASIHLWQQLSVYSLSQFQYKESRELVSVSMRKSKLRAKSYFLASAWLLLLLYAWARFSYSRYLQGQMHWAWITMRKHALMSIPLLRMLSIMQWWKTKRSPQRYSGCISTTVS